MKLLLLLPAVAKGSLLLASGGTCADLGCSAAGSAAQCGAWGSELQNATQSAAAATGASVPLGCYLFDSAERLYFSADGGASGQPAACSADRRCICRCPDADGALHLAIYVGLGTTARARANPLAVLRRAPAATPAAHGRKLVRAVNFSAADVTRHLATPSGMGSYDAILFPGGEAGAQAAAIGAAQRRCSASWRRAAATSGSARGRTSRCSSTWGSPRSATSRARPAAARVAAAAATATAPSASAQRAPPPSGRSA
jgi:hypothetical protein